MMRSFNESFRLSASKCLRFRGLFWNRAHLGYSNHRKICLFINRSPRISIWCAGHFNSTNSTSSSSRTCSMSLFSFAFPIVVTIHVHGPEDVGLPRGRWCWRSGVLSNAPVRSWNLEYNTDFANHWRDGVMHVENMARWSNIQEILQNIHTRHQNRPHGQTCTSIKTLLNTDCANRQNIYTHIYIYT